LGGLSSEVGIYRTGDKSVIGGLAYGFYHRSGYITNTNEAWNCRKKTSMEPRARGTPAMDGENRTMRIFEPHCGGKRYLRICD